MDYFSNEDLRMQIAALQMHVKWLMVEHFKSNPDPIGAAEKRKNEIEDLGNRLIASSSGRDTQIMLNALHLVSSMKETIDEAIKEL